jgi:hypothetical protein
MYDPAIGRWLSVDPKREFASGYLGMGNNPVSNTDPDGGEITDWYKNEKTGKTEWHVNNPGKGYTWIGNKDFSPDLDLIDRASLPKNFEFKAVSGGENLNFTHYGNGFVAQVKSYAMQGAPLDLPIGPGGGGKLLIKSFDDIIVGLSKIDVKQGYKYISKLDARSVYKSLRSNGYDLIHSAANQKVLSNPKTGEVIRFTKSNTGGYKGFDSAVKSIENTGKNLRVFFQNF